MKKKLKKMIDRLINPKNDTGFPVILILIWSLIWVGNTTTLLLSVFVYDCNNLLFYIFAEVLTLFVFAMAMGMYQRSNEN